MRRKRFEEKAHLGGSVAIEEYFIAIKRGARETAPKNWIEILESVNGVKVIGAGPTRAQFRASSEAIEQVGNLLGGYCHIERKILHRPLSK